MGACAALSCPGVFQALQQLGITAFFFLPNGWKHLSLSPAPRSSAAGTSAVPHAGLHLHKCAEEGSSGSRRSSRSPRLKDCPAQGSLAPGRARSRSRC